MAESKSNLELADSRDAMNLIPNWEPDFWWIAAIAILLLLLWFSGRYLLRKKKVFDPLKARREAFQQALAGIGTLDESLGKENVIMVSLVIRKYLAQSLNEPALYETHEEFIGRHDAIDGLNEELKAMIQAYFSELAAMKYGPDDGRVIDVNLLKQQAVNLLERIHAS
jgi:hypothetical protein